MSKNMCSSMWLIKVIYLCLLVCSVPEASNMALSFLLVLAATVILIRPETPLTKVKRLMLLSQRVSACFYSSCTYLIMCECCSVYRPYIRTQLSAAVTNWEGTTRVPTTLTVNPVMWTFYTSVKQLWGRLSALCRRAWTFNHQLYYF